LFNLISKKGVNDGENDIHNNKEEDEADDDRPDVCPKEIHETVVSNMRNFFIKLFLF
jgi:hypothetical protein